MVGDFKGKYSIIVGVSCGQAYISVHLDRDSARGDTQIVKRLFLDGALTDVLLSEWRPKSEDGFGDEIFEYHTDNLDKWYDSLSDKEAADFIRQKN